MRNALHSAADGGVPVSRHVYFITHPDVVVDPGVPVPQWPLSERGRERMRKLLRYAWVRDISAVFCSDERKAIDGATILAEHLGIPFEVDARLGENDRSSTGYLPQDEFQQVADQFFARPTESVRGWERADDAQTRITAAVAALTERFADETSIAVVSHGGVGTLLLCRAKDVSISRLEEQPGKSGGNYFICEFPGPVLRQGWAAIDA